MARETYRVMRRPDGTQDIVLLSDVAAWEAEHRPKTTSPAGWTPRRVTRGSWVLRNGKLIPKAQASLQRRGRGLQVISDIEPFRNIAVDNKPVMGRRQRRDMMRAHNLIEVGNDMRAEPRKEPPRKVDMSLIRDIKRAMGKL